MNTYQKICDLLTELRHWEIVAERENLGFAYRYSLHTAIVGLAALKRFL